VTIETTTLHEQATSHAGRDAVRFGNDQDVHDGVQPRIVVTPTTRGGLASTLTWAFAQGLSVSVRGGGTKQSWGGSWKAVDVLLCMTHFDRVIAHRHGDLTATVEAGATLAAVNHELAAEGQWLPLDPPWPERATIGGIVSTNDSGPARQTHGAPRDLIIGVTVARPDGAVAKAGGIVVKNVAGYDVSRLVTGAFGSLAVVIDATFKLAPRPRASRTVTVASNSLEELETVIAAVSTSSLTPSAVELEWAPARVIVRFDSVQTAVDQQADELARLVAAVSAAAVATSLDEAVAETEVWGPYRQRWDEHGTLVKVSTVPRRLVPTLAWLRDAADADGVRMAAQGRAALGVVDVLLDGPFDAQARVITALRARCAPGDGSAVVRRGALALRHAIDPWGPIGDALPVMRAIKQRFDPDGILNAGRGPA